MVRELEARKGRVRLKDRVCFGALKGISECHKD